MKKPFTSLAIDTSFDETSVSVVQGTTILSNVLPSQMEFHRKYGGVVPSIAKLAHQERIDNVVVDAMKKAKVTFEDIDTISVTQGPGLAIALEVGIKKAKELALKYEKPLITVNHMEGHLLSSIAERNQKTETRITKNLDVQISDFEFPVLAFLVSGNHTELILVKDLCNYEKIGETVDDSCGEAYDKCGRILGLGFPAGPVISEFANTHRKNMKIEYLNSSQSKFIKATNIHTHKSYELPVAMANSGDLNMSFSGLKTAFKQLVESLAKKIDTKNDTYLEASGISKEYILDLCVAFEAAALKQLEIKLEKAIKLYSPKEIWLGGGVVASSRLRSQLRKVGNKFGLETRYPYSKKLTTDNAAMIGVVANIRTWKFQIDKHNPKQGIYLKDFDKIDREPSLSF